MSSSSMASLIPNSAITSSSQHPLLQQQLNVFALPSQILDGLTVRSVNVPTTNTSSAQRDNTNIDENLSKMDDEELGAAEGGGGGGSGLSCGICPGAKFEDVSEQRAHYKEDWHRYNVRVKMTAAGVGGGEKKDSKGKGRVLGREEFEGMVEGLSSISGSESTTSSQSTDDKVTTLLRKQNISSSSPNAPANDNDDASSNSSGDAQFLSNRAALRTALVWFTPPSDLLPSTQLGVYRALFPSHLTDPSTFLPRLRELQLTPEDLKAVDKEGGEERRWVLLMVAGGHFAGMVVGIGGKRTGKKVVKGAAGENIRILKHKTFHRYTTRRKQGGSQSSHDKANGAANSIGAQIRRAGEVMLKEEIRELLFSWQEDFNVAERVFVRGSVSGKKIFWGYDEAVIDKSDERIRTFPFPTRRPTLAELVRCYQELTRVKTSFLTESALAALEADYIASLLPKQPSAPSKPSTSTPALPAAPAKPKLSEAEERSRERWRRMVEMIRKGKIDALGTFWGKHSGEMGLDEVLPSSGEIEGGEEGKQLTKEGRLPEWLWEEEGKGKESTLLMVATVAGQEEIVRWLLEEKRVDPTVPVPSPSFFRPTFPSSTITATDPPSADTPSPDDDRSSSPSSTKLPPFRTAYDLSPSRPIRSLFRRLAYEHPTWHDWVSQSPGGARVPSGLSAEMEEEQGAKKMERRKGLKEKMKEREKKREEEEAAKAAAAPPPPPPAPVVKKEEPVRKGPQRLGGGGPGGDMPGGLTPEMRQRIERERRARAAEARMTRG